jgi:hypothetical protein
MKKIDPEAVRARICRVVQREAELPEAVANDVAFHMTDWIKDLETYARFCATPGRMSDKEVAELLTDFLVHVPNHVAAASKLYTDITVSDVFGVGATCHKGNQPSRPDRGRPGGGRC